MADIPGETIRLSESDVKVGVALPWNTFDSSGRLLLREGAVITSNNQLSALLQRGMYRQITPQDDVQIPPPPAAAQRLNPFSAMSELLEQSQTLLKAIVHGRAENVRQRVESTCIDLDVIYNNDADAALAAMHLDQEGSYCVRHSLYCALVAGLIARRRGYAQDTRMAVMAAALTANVGMMDLQEELLNHEGPLSEETWEEIKGHPERSVSLLKASGIDDAVWLATVEQHHERGDGSGYNKGLSGAAIHEGAKIVGVADRYHVLISDRARRRGLPPTDSLRKLFILKEHLDEDCILAFIKEVGIYPPGVYVRLFNGEIGLVIRRGEDGVSPQVAGIIGPRGVPYLKPYVRDCRMSEYAIKERADPLAVPASSLHELWGYGHAPK
jgi:HD-GYP domain-containing protein (c-di-GMP phosphodiesterase class II)